MTHQRSEDPQTAHFSETAAHKTTTNIWMRIARTFVGALYALLSATAANGIEQGFSGVYTSTYLGFITTRLTNLLLMYFPIYN